MRIAYFINQYPKVSHSFIRREILALERQGFEVQRIALRMGRHADRTWPYHLIYLAEACCLVSWMRAFDASHVHFGTNPAEVAIARWPTAGWSKPSYS